MQMAAPPRPSFCRILFDASAPHLALPPDFVSKHLENKIPKNPTLRSEGGRSWRLKIKQIGGKYCFTHKWRNVVEDNQLGYGDFLKFSLLDQSTFKVTIFGPNGCKKDLPSTIPLEEEVDDDEKDLPSRIPAEEEDDDSDDDNKDDDDDEVEEDEDDEDDGDDDNKDDDDGDDSGDVDGDDGDPFFLKIISKAHKHVLRLPAEFVRFAGIDTEGKITMKNLDGIEWQMSLRSERHRQKFYLSSGWRDFFRSNELSEGDECLFKFIGREGKLALAKVTKKRMAARKDKSPLPIVKEDEFWAVEMPKRKRGRPRLGEEMPKRKRGRPRLEECRRRRRV